jgi:endonuclease YncB( thermonuclease family)
VRLVQIDAPEFGSECYGRRAASVLERLLPFGTEVRVVRDPGLDDVDVYGRLLRYVFKASRNVNLVLVQRGAASPYFFGGDEGRYAGRFRHAVDRARAQGRGAWGACNADYDLTRSWDVRYKQGA